MVPLEGFARLGVTQMDMVESEMLGVLDQFEPHAPGVYDEAEREKTLHVPTGRRDRGTRTLDLGELCTEVRE